MLNIPVPPPQSDQRLHIVLIDLWEMFQYFLKLIFKLITV